MRRLLVFFLAALILVGIGAGLGILFSGRSAPQQSALPQVVTVPVLITATRDPNATEVVRIVTATPLPGSVGALPTNLFETPGSATRSAPTLDAALLNADAALQQTVTALPENCILHTVSEGDTPFGIAQIYGANGFAIMEINGLTEETATQLQIGDVLIVPLEGCPLTAAPASQAAGSAETTSEASAEITAEATESEATAPTLTVVPTITLAPTAANAQVEIVRVISAGDITLEGVEIRNLGGVVNLTGWTLSDSQGNVFTFPEQRLFTNGLVTVYTRVGQNTPIALYWGRSTAVWGDPGDTITLANASGVVQSSLRMGGS